MRTASFSGGGVCYNHAATPNDKRMIVAICVGLIALTWFVFGQTLGHEFINYDDPEYVFENPQISKGLTLHGIAWALSHSHAHNWHPLTTITHMLDCQLYGLKADGHHCTNVVLHILAVVLLFLVLGEMTGGPSRTGNIWPSAFVAAVFAIHPLRAESVAWVAERKDVLSGVFFMLTLAAYLRYVRKRSLASYLLVALVFALGLMSKPMLVTLPFVLLLVDYWPLRRFAAQASQKNNVKPLHWLDRQSIPWKLVWEKIPLLVLAVISCGIALVLQAKALSSIAILPLWVRVYNALVSCVIYIWQMFWPAKLALFYPLPSGTLSGSVVVFAIAVLFALTYTAWALRKQRPHIITGWLWYLGMLVPVIGLVLVGGQGRADRYTYLPQIGLYVAATWVVMDLSASWRHRREILSILATAVVIILTWRAGIQTSYWKNSESIWTRTLAVTSNNAIAHEKLGFVLLKNSQVDDAISHLQEALKIWPDFDQGRSNPGNARVHYKLAAAFFKKGRVGEAISHYQIALQLSPDYADVHDRLASLLWQEGQIDQAIENWQKTLSTDPDDPRVHTSLGTALLRKGLVGEAISHYEKSLAIAPQSTVTLNNLALVLSTCSDARFRNGSRAIQLAEQADQLSGRKNPSIVRTLAAAYAESGRFNDAIAAAERALQLATAQGDSALVSTLRMDIDLYRMNFPRRSGGP
jgi:tetratricopeptide (TPR) repeat protein